MWVGRVTRLIRLRIRASSPTRAYNRFIEHGGPAPEALSSNDSRCRKTERISITSRTGKVATLTHVLLDDLGLRIARPAAG